MQPHIDRIGSGKSQITRVESIRENVAALDGRLEILVACMPPEPVLLAMSSDTRDPANPSFARPFPFKGAFFNADVCNEVMVRARAYGKPCMSSDGARWSDRNPDFDDVRGHYVRDINQLHEALFHEPSDTERAFTLCQAGLFTRPRTRSLHYDGDAQDAQYFARIGPAFGMHQP